MSQKEKAGDLKLEKIQNDCSVTTKGKVEALRDYFGQGRDENPDTVGSPIGSASHTANWQLGQLHPILPDYRPTVTIHS